MHTNLSAIILDTDDDFISREQLFFFFRVGTDIVFGSYTFCSRHSATSESPNSRVGPYKRQPASL